MTEATNTAVAAGAAMAEALLPLAGPKGQAAALLLSQGLAFWTNFAGKMASGTLTISDAETAAAMLGSSIDKLKADISTLPDA